VPRLGTGTPRSMYAEEDTITLRNVGNYFTARLARYSYHTAQCATINHCSVILTVCLQENRSVVFSGCPRAAHTHKQIHSPNVYRLNISAHKTRIQYASLQFCLKKYTGYFGLTSCSPLLNVNPKIRPT